MQPETPQRPVMDVTAPHRPTVPAPTRSVVAATPSPTPAAPATTAPAPAPTVPPASTPAAANPGSLPVHEAPKVNEDAVTNKSAEQAVAPESEPQKEEKPAPPPKQPKQPKSLPVGTIVVTVLAMVGLSAVATAVYLTSQ